MSSKGNESLADSLASKMGSDVRAMVDVNYVRFSPKYDACGDVIGTEIVQVL